MKTLTTVWMDEDSRIARNEIPVRPGLRVIQTNNPEMELTQDEIIDRDEFVRLSFLNGFEPLLSLPVSVDNGMFYSVEFIDAELDYLRLMDSKDRNRYLKRYSFAIQKVMEKVRDLALMHSAISTMEVKENTKKRCVRIIDDEFGARLRSMVERYHRANDTKSQVRFGRGIVQLKRRILEAKVIWERYAP